jgi:transcription elongation factor Elf1
MIKTKCPYCGEYNSNNFTFKISSNKRDVICKKCSLIYKVSFRVEDSVYTYEEELKKVLPQEKIDTIKNVISKYFNYQGKGGYQNSRTITLSSDLAEYISNSDNALVISFMGRATYYGNEYRKVRFYVTANDVWAEVTSMYNWRQSHWFKGETLDEQVDSYIQHALVKWETI